MFKNLENEKAAEPGLKQYLSPVAVWALSFGCAVGWGSFVMPGTTFLPVAGPAGTTVGIILGAIVMLIIGVNYHYMMNRFPDSGGTYTCLCCHNLGKRHSASAHFQKSFRKHLSVWFSLYDCRI